MFAEVWWSPILNVCLLIKPTLASDWSATVTSGFLIGHWGLALTEPHICILASLFPSYADGMQVGSLQKQPMRGWKCHQLANQRLGDWWVRGWPVVTSVVTVIRVRSPNMGHGRLMNVGCHTVIDMGKAGFFKSPPTNTLYCYPLDIVCIFPPRLAIQIDFVLASWDLWVVLMSGCLAVWWGNENGLCDIQSDKNMDFWKMKYETAHYATG